MGYYSTDGLATEDDTAHEHSIRIPQATNINSEYVIPNALPLKQELRERVPVLSYTYCTLPVLFYM